MPDNPQGFFEGTEMPDAGWWEALWPDPAGVLAAVGIAPGMTVVDLCSGDGWFTLQIAKLAKRVIAIDIDPTLLKVTEYRLAESGVSNCDFVAGDAYDLTQLAPAPVDFVFMANAFHGVPARPRLSRAVRDTLRSGGRFAIVNWHPRQREQTTVLGEPRGPRTELRLSSGATMADAQEGDLKRVDVIGVPPYHYAAVLERP